MISGILTGTYATTAKDHAGEAFVDAFVVCLVVMSLPIKNLGYIVPPLFIGLALLAGNTAFVRRTLLWICLAVCISTLSLIIDSSLGQRVNLPGLVIGILTFASLAVILALRSDFSIGRQPRERLSTVVAWWAIVQSIVGLGQFALTRNSDAVCGTMGLLEGFTGSITITQVYFTFNLFCMVLFLLLDARKRLTRIAIILSLLTCMLAHSGHQTVFLLMSIALVGILQLKLKDVVKLLALLVLLVSLTLTVSSIYWSDIEGWYGKTLIDEGSPKRQVTISAGEILSAPKNFLLGVGVGQFGSRAALITSGGYLTVELPPVLVGQSDYFRGAILPAQYDYEQYGEHSAMTKPYYSLLNVVVEFGVPLSILLFGALLAEFLRNRRFSRSSDRRTWALGIWANVGLVFLLLCCCIENYLEFPQAIFLPALLYVAARTTPGGTDQPIDR